MSGARSIADTLIDLPWPDGLLVWVHLEGACLGAQIDRARLRCGNLNDVPGDRLATWFTSWTTLPRDGRSLETLADEIHAWIARETERWRQARREASPRDRA